MVPLINPPWSRSLISQLSSLLLFLESFPVWLSQGVLECPLESGHLCGRFGAGRPGSQGLIVCISPQLCGPSCLRGGSKPPRWGGGPAPQKLTDADQVFPSRRARCSACPSVSLTPVWCMQPGGFLMSPVSLGLVLQDLWLCLGLGRLPSLCLKTPNSS